MLVCLASYSAIAQSCDFNNPVERKFIASDAAASDKMGGSVSIDGDRFISGAYLDDDNGMNSGSVYIYDFNGAFWTETKLTASDGASDDWYGYSVAISGDRAIVGAYKDDDNIIDSGSAYIYDWNGTTWVETKITASDHMPVDQFGYAVAISGDRIVVGANMEDDNGLESGAVYVYDWDGTTWNETKIIASDGSGLDEFGSAVALDGDRLVVGAPFDDVAAANSGSIYVYDYDGTNWIETKLSASDGAITDEFGTSVAVSGDRVVSGAYRDDDNGNGSGSAYVYDWNGTNWNETKILASNGSGADRFGYAVGIDTDRIVVGAYLKDITGVNGGSVGSVYSYNWNGASWDETEIIYSNASSGDGLGISVSISNDRILAGATGYSVGGGAFIFDCGELCPPDYAGPNTLTGVITNNALYETPGLLQSTQTLSNNATVYYDSMTEIELLPGFETQLGFIFLAHIDGCGQ